MNNLVERLREEAEWYSGHVNADRWRLSTVENKTRHILIEAADTLLALQTQLAAAELKAKEWIDVAYEAASQKEELKRELERVERETVERIKSPLFRQFLRQGFWHAHHVDLVWRYDGKDIREEADWLKDVWYALLPSAKTETETE